MTESKSEQLQIRVSAKEKVLLRRMAKDAGVSLSEFVLSRVLGSDRRRFHDVARSLARAESKSFAFAELNDLLSGLSRERLPHAIAERPTAQLDSYTWNYLAAMVEVAALRKNLPIPQWIMEIEPLSNPVFATSLESLRLHLLTSAPLPFRRRNIFVDSSVGDRV